MVRTKRLDPAVDKIRPKLPGAIASGAEGELGEPQDELRRAPTVASGVASCSDTAPALESVGDSEASSPSHEEWSMLSHNFSNLPLNGY